MKEGTIDIYKESKNNEHVSNKRSRVRTALCKRAVLSKSATLAKGGSSGFPLHVQPMYKKAEVDQVSSEQQQCGGT